MSDEYQSLVVDLLRHGEVKGGRAFWGSTDVSLSAKGYVQMGARIGLDALCAENTPWQLIVSSPLSRCRVFAEQVAEKLQVPLLINDKLQEIHFGEWEGLTAHQLSSQSPERFQLYCDDPIMNTPPEGEAFLAFKKRVETGWSEITSLHLQPQRVLVISHGGVIRTLLAKALDCPDGSIFKISCPYACLSQVEHFASSEGTSDVMVAHNTNLDLSIV